MLRQSYCIDEVKNKFRCLACSYASEEIEDTNKHFMEKHRDTFRLPCIDCNMKFKTIEELKVHYAAKHFKKNIKKKRCVLMGEDYSTGYVDDSSY